MLQSQECHASEGIIHQLIPSELWTTMALCLRYALNVVFARRDLSREQARTQVWPWLHGLSRARFCFVPSGFGVLQPDLD